MLKSAEQHKARVTPFSLQDKPSLIERLWPAQKISVEAQKERKANVGQTLTVLGAYWKGRKPLVLVRACILGALLPATNDSERDLAVFELLMGMDDAAFLTREQSMSASETARLAEQSGIVSHDELRRCFRVRGGRGASQVFDEALSAGRLAWACEPEDPLRLRMRSVALSQLSFFKKVDISKRVEECTLDPCEGVWDEINAHLGTNARSIAGLVEQLGIMRFGRKPKIADTFAGGCSIPFEAARLGCDVLASDLNPVACMLSWGAFNLLGGHPKEIEKVEAAQSQLSKNVDARLRELGVESDGRDGRAKAYLYCLETTCPQTGWNVPLIPNLTISTDRRTAARLRPNHSTKTIEVDVVVLDDDQWSTFLKDGSAGTVRNGYLHYDLDNQTYSTSVKSIRGDARVKKGFQGNNALRRWEATEFTSRSTDVFRERLYCIQWMTPGRRGPETVFAAPTLADLERERAVIEIVSRNIAAWQQNGTIPNDPIEPGEKTDEPIRTRGWTHWHHLFAPRQLLTLGITKQLIDSSVDQVTRSALTIGFARSLDRMAKLCQWSATPAQDIPLRVFVNQALNPLSNWGVRANGSYLGALELSLEKASFIEGEKSILCRAANTVDSEADIYVTDPPYADAVNYHEITEFFIAWFKKNPPPLFSGWTWDSRRPLAIKGSGEAFRHDMVDAYRAMADHMPETGLQIVMFTHQSASVWADMAQIFWGAGLQVMAAWYIATETTSELKKGGYVQGTVILVLRKRKAEEAGYKDEVVQEVRAEVADQIDTMVGLNQSLKGSGRIENLFEDADLQMAGYAAALRVLTRYQRIDGTDMTKEALRQRRPGEKDLVGEVIEFAVQVANEHMVPEHMPPKVWERLSGPERFYFKMMDIETTSLRKLDNYQNFAKAFRVAEYAGLMGSVEPNKASVKSAKQFRKAGFEIPDFGPSATRALLYAIFELENDVEGDEVLAHLRDQVASYHSKRDELVSLADYVARKRAGVDDAESRAARILFDLIRNERFG